MPSQDQPWPIPSRFSSFTPLIDPDRAGKKLADGYGPVLQQKLMLLWGKATPLLICPDTWLLEMKESKEEEAMIKLSWTRVSYIIQIYKSIACILWDMGILLDAFGEFCVYFHHVCMQLYIPLKPRSWHIARPVYRPNSTECDVVIFGGNVHIEGHYGDRDNSADLKILSSGMRNII